MVAREKGLEQPLGTAEVAHLLREIGQTELTDETPHRARAYYRAAENLLTVTEPLDQMIAEGRLREIPGVGPAITEKIVALHRTGTHRTLERLREAIPASALELLRIPGLGAQKARQLYQDLRIASIDELEEACRRDALVDVRGFGPAMQRKALQGIEMLRRSRRHRLINHADEFLAAIVANLQRSSTELERIEPAGDVRRGCDLVCDLRLAGRIAVPMSSVQTVSINDEVDLYVADEPRYGVALLLATGSAAHVEALQRFAESRNLRLGPEGLRQGGKLIPCPEERDVYDKLGLPFISPELRESGDEVALAAEGRLPELVEQEDLHGVLHCHTDRSDGVNSLEEMAEAARQRGYRYIGVADHSRSAGYAGGLSVEQVEAQLAEIDRLNRGYRGRFHILKGIESDILPDGSLDYPDEVLARFDLVVASVHSRFRLDREAQTARIVRAVSNPFTTILGHPTGRLLLRRDGYDVDVDRVLQACAEDGVVVEINCNPRRLDLDWRWHRRGLELGCLFSINPDAHSIAELDFMRWGVAAARKGGLAKARILNVLNSKAMTTRLRERKSKVV
ncbi:MAG TPA: helix-hairpin-helix domain-containing protein [Afifellaceae bacterium]|nr:helix-hairpin-helix domain-containing protein [Afifellaceae bacterium]